MERYEKGKLNEEVIISIFNAITSFQNSLSNRCHRGYEETIARIIRDQLERIFYKMLRNQHPIDDDKALQVTAVMLSWGIYGASVEWRRNQHTITPEEFINSALPYIMNGIDATI